VRESYGGKGVRMSKMIVLYNLKPGTDPDSWHRFLREEDIPQTLKFPSVQRYSVFNVTDSLDDDSPYEYMEIIEFGDREEFDKDMNSEAWREAVAGLHRNGLGREVAFFVSELS
jgi:hypothetical protein